MRVARSGLGISLLPVGGGGHFEKAQRITDPPIHSSFLEMTPHEFYLFWKRPPQPIDVKTTNIVATNSADVHHISYLQTSVFKIHLVFIIYCCYNQSQFTLVTCFDLLSWSNAPFSENDSQNKSCKILKMIPEQNGRPP